MTPFMPPSDLCARLPLKGLDRPSSLLGPELTCALTSRRTFLSAMGAALFMFESNEANAAKVFSAPSEDAEVEPVVQSEAQYEEKEQLRLGEIPQDFWYRPRELWLRRQGTRQETRVVYWKDGQLVSDGYWQACAMLRDVKQNVMTTMDPAILDVLRGITGYYQAWGYPQPIVLTSGFRTAKTNATLSGEGAAKNSMHLYGKAVDLYVPGIPAKDVGALGMHLRQGGVGFYPSRGFTHLDTGRLRTWVGR